MSRECDSRCIAAHHQPAVLVDLALERGIDSHRLLRGTGLFREEIASGERLITPRQFLALIANTERLLGASEISFLFGQRQLPGHYGSASHALQHAANLHEALLWLGEQRARLSPLLRPRLRLDQQTAWLFWDDSYGAGAQLRFLVEAAMAALVSVSRWLSGSAPPWQFHLPGAKPRHIEQYWVHLGEQLHFEQPLTAMTLPRQWLFAPWRGASPTAGEAARRQAQREMAPLEAEGSLREQLFDYLSDNIRRQPLLETAARHFAMSPATLKRKLHRHGTHFQAELDYARTHAALWLYRSQGFSSDEVAAWLNFSDAANFRRSFKRWTGLAPSALMAQLPPG